MHGKYQCHCCSPEDHAGTATHVTLGMCAPLYAADMCLGIQVLVCNTAKRPAPTMLYELERHSDF